MQLSELGISEKKLKQFQKANIETAEDLLTYYPKRYIDRTQIAIRPPTEESVFFFMPHRIRRCFGRIDTIHVCGTLCNSTLPVNVTWFNQSFLYESIAALQNTPVLVAGKVQEDASGYSVAAPTLYSGEGEAALRMYPVYKRIPGMSEEYLSQCIRKAFDALMPLPENLPVPIGITHDEMVRALHHPGKSLKAALQRKRLEDLAYFALRIGLSVRGTALGSPFTLTSIRTMKAAEASLPYQLHADQRQTLQSAIEQIRSGQRLNALIQGDVGCGKTIIAMLLMIAFAENGWQAALMAPTQILAAQHYEELQRLATPYGFQVALISGQKLRKAEQAALQDGLSSGRFSLVVGTQALLSENYNFHNLALVIEDEDHKYGVMQREKLVSKAANGTHTITMSATPIPRSLAQTIYGNTLCLYSIHSKPVGRKPIRTGIAVSMERVYQFLVREILTKGRQAYVVCPMISKSEQGVASVEAVFQQYQNELSKYGISIAALTGKSKDTTEVLDSFSRNEISILVATTVIEVGVNIPNATCMVVHNAERFGLSQLHQIRGRVGRGVEQGTCVLISEDRSNPRLQAMCEHTDGFEIAEIDLHLRGAGDFLGTQQSGTEYYLSLALAHPEECQEASKIAKHLLDKGIDCPLLRQAEKDWKEGKAGEMLQS